MDFELLEARLRALAIEAGIEIMRI